MLTYTHALCRCRLSACISTALQIRTGSRFEAALAWYFVAVWGSGFIATKYQASDASSQRLCTDVCKAKAAKEAAAI